MNVVDLIMAKRDGHRLTDEQIRWFIAAYTEGGIVADEQAAAMAMAIFFQGMEPDELAVWTEAMLDSGERLDLSQSLRPTVDKHSTGGVGDKVTLILTPLVVACGAAVPQLSGRGLGHTGGTLDKLESIAGWQASITNEQMGQLLKDVGGFIAGATENLAPADRKLYALRDVTGTVDSIPLIASSIMSKKIAEGTASLVLDVKTGSGAFKRERSQAFELARTMVDLGNANGVHTRALVTNMDTVLGVAVGNAVEVQESFDILAGDGPADTIELTLALAREMLDLAGIDVDPAPKLRDGSAMEAFERLIAAQGGDLSQPLPVAEKRHVVTADRAGFITRLDARGVGVAAWRLGAGRAHKEDPVSAIAGVVCLKKEGDAVAEGEPVLELHLDDVTRLDRALAALDGAIVVGDQPGDPTPLVLDRIG